MGNLMRAVVNSRSAFPLVRYLSYVFTYGKFLLSLLCAPFRPVTVDQSAGFLWEGFGWLAVHNIRHKRMFVKCFLCFIGVSKRLFKIELGCFGKIGEARLLSTGPLPLERGKGRADGRRPPLVVLRSGSCGPWRVGRPGRIGCLWGFCPASWAL